MIVLALGLPQLALAVDKKKKKAMPQGTPVLWRAPDDLPSRDLFLGPGGSEMKPDLSRVIFVKEEKGGYSKKFRVRDASGREWVAKIGKEAQSETAAVRLLWAAGYVTEINYLVPRLNIEGKGVFENVRLEARPEKVKRLDEWKWSDNPFVGTKELQGLIVMMALLNNWDIKDSNNKILVVDGKNGRKELRYEVHDLGASFGKYSHLPRWIQFKPDRNNPKAYAKTHLVDKVKENGDVRLHYSVKRSDLFKGISVEDARWLGGLVGRLSQRQIADAFRSANYSPEQVRLMTEAVAKRVSELKSLPANSQLARRRVRAH